MSLEYSIDRADFRALVDVALRRIPTASRGQWTLHAPVDPGITLVELFAWLLEQRSYLADRATAPMVRAVLALFGDAVRGARPAGTVLTFAPELEPDGARLLAPHAHVPRRTALRVPETDIVFTLQHGLTALALARHPDNGPPILALDGVAGFGAEDLRGGRPIPLLPAHGGPAQAQIGLTLQAPAPAGARLRAAILFELDTGVQPEWSPDAADARPPARLRWEYRSQGGQWRPLARLRDGTLGLRRSGIVRFAVPADWEYPLAWLRVATERATFSAPPSVLRIVPNSALASDLRWLRVTTEPLPNAAPAANDGALALPVPWSSDPSPLDWLPLPGRTLQLDPDALPLPRRLFVCATEPAGRRRWRAADDFTQAGPADRVVVVDRSRARIVFGDGLNGRLPRLSGNPPALCVTYAAGGGRRGNVPPGRFEALTGPLAQAQNATAAVGGRDDETLDEARARAAAALRTPTRAVTAGDHAAIAVATPGVAVARAHAAVGFVAGECGVVPGVTAVFVVPGIASRTREQVRAGAAVSAPVADPGMLDEVRAALSRARLAGEAISVGSALYRRLRVRVVVTGAPYDPPGLRRRLSAALRLYLDPLLGGDDGTGWPFGGPIRPTALLGVAQREAGDRGEVAEVAVAVDDAAPLACGEIAIRSHELVAVDAIDVIIASPAGAQVGLR